MNGYMHFSRDVDLWEPSTQVVWGSHNFWPLSQFQVRAIMLSEPHVLSHAGAWGNIKIPRHNIMFLLIVPDKTVKGERVFGLVAVWMHLHQACHHPWVRQHISLHC